MWFCNFSPMLLIFPLVSPCRFKGGCSSDTAALKYSLRRVMVYVDLFHLLTVCVRGALAAQRYIVLELLKVQDLDTQQPTVAIMDQDSQTKKTLMASLHRAVTVKVKGHFYHKNGDAATDLVTTADLVTQAVIEQVLGDAFPDMPFTIVGEEEPASRTVKFMAAYCVEKYYKGLTAIPYQSELEAHVRCTRSQVSAASWRELRERVGVFVDPVDGTNCFVEGLWDVPLTLVGLTLDGAPVAGVVNRVFRFSLDQMTSNSSSTSLSYVWNLGPGIPFIVHEGQRVAPDVAAKPAAAGSVLRVANSSTTDSSYFVRVVSKLAPIEQREARGAGNKLLFLVSSMLAGSSTTQSCDVFISPEDTIKKWDTCAPHAFVLALGGELHTLRGELVRYPVRGGERARLPAGVLGVSRCSKFEVMRRLGWLSSSL
ncbi:inositol polyphosphate 1-phosphatase [Trypanosoma rangeli]|uniref:3'(2'),5'-bisphosphate nucleotidase n=1 Tax=Trypanosoma rangeli TaxID=5698 RepID=A0A3R7KA15_TRYRA|nr:inositol polyphosphate 1-phosphatase [Trypanosoma rangeli]RNF04119.1 inositol polyphosphate 1-phosphatase [Trypanosoma rangeli]|eukprot:RNF04119.1 inositol polyphosphate 1-phosphatase [Trypanosoma rangeli]